MGYEGIGLVLTAGNSDGFTRHHQQVLDWQVSAGGDLVHQTDGFGNVLSCLTLNQPHQTLLIQAQGRIRIDAQADYVRDEQLNPLLFQAPSELTHADDALWDFAHTALKRCDRAGLVALAGAIEDGTNGFPWWWLLLLLIPVIGWLVILIFNCQRGTEGNNRFGPDPKPFSY